MSYDRIYNKRNKQDMVSKCLILLKSLAGKSYFIKEFGQQKRSLLYTWRRPKTSFHGCLWIFIKTSLMTHIKHLVHRTSPNCWHWCFKLQGPLPQEDFLNPTKCSSPQSSLLNYGPTWIRISVKSCQGPPQPKPDSSIENNFKLQLG